MAGGSSVFEIKIHSSPHCPHQILRVVSALYSDLIALKTAVVLLAFGFSQKILSGIRPESDQWSATFPDTARDAPDLSVKSGVRLARGSGLNAELATCLARICLARKTVSLTAQ